MRKWILNWLFGSNAKRWEDMFKIACECHVECKEMLNSSRFLLEQYKAISDEFIAVLNVLQNATDIRDLRVGVLKVLNKPKENTPDENKED